MYVYIYKTCMVITFLNIEDIYSILFLEEFLTVESSTMLSKREIITCARVLSLFHVSQNLWKDFELLITESTSECNQQQKKWNTPFEYRGESCHTCVCACLYVSTSLRKSLGHEIVFPSTDFLFPRAVKSKRGRRMWRIQSSALCVNEKKWSKAGILEAEGT